jgi:O-antigen/teichoic acid export membrane protein
MEKISSLSKATAWYTIGNLFVRSVSFLLLPLYSNLISTSEFGNYALIMAFYAIIAVLYQAGLPSALNKFYLEENDFDKRKIIFSTLINLAFIISVALTVIVFLFSGTIARAIVGSENYSGILRIVFLALFFENLASIILYLMQTNQLPKKMVFYSFCGAFLNLLINVVLVYFLSKGIYGIFLAQLISNIFLLIITFPYLKKNYISVFDRKLVKKISEFSFPLIAAGLLSAAVVVIDRFIINNFLGKKEVGIYSFSYRIAMIMNIFVVSLRNAWIPYSINLYRSGEYSKSFGKSFTKIIAAGLFIFLFISMFIDDLFGFHINTLHLFDLNYKSGIVIIPLILFSYLLNGVVNYYSVYPYISGKSIHFLFSDIVALALNLIFNLLLIPLYGIVGAAVATFISYLGSTVYMLILSSKKMKIYYEPVKLTVLFLFAGIIYFISKWFNIIYVDIVLFLTVIIFIKKTIKVNFKILGEI